MNDSCGNIGARRNVEVADFTDALIYMHIYVYIYIIFAYVLCNDKMLKKYFNTYLRRQLGRINFCFNTVVQIFDESITISDSFRR